MTTYTYECEIRDLQDHYSTDDPANDADFTEVVNTLHQPRENDLTTADRVSVYVHDDHDQSFDMALQSTPGADGDYTDTVGEQTVTLGGTDTRFTVDGPLGNLRLYFQSGSLSTAPASGSCRVTIRVWP